MKRFTPVLLLLVLGVLLTAPRWAQACPS